MTISSNLLEIKHKIANLCADVTLVAVSKFQDKANIMQALAAGQRVFGENRVQEAAAKWPELQKLYPDIKLHLIGALQTNKADDAVLLFDIIESLDRRKLADCLVKSMHKHNKFIPCLVQVNIGRELQKAGIMPDETDEFIAYCKNKGLKIEGLMCIPPEGEQPEQYFEQLQLIAKRNKLDTLSMGMSSDFPAAIKFGATHVRVGTAIFGSRT